MRIARTKLPIDDIRELFDGKDALDDFSQHIMKQNLFCFLCGYQYDRKDKRIACDILKFNIRDVLVEEQIKNDFKKELVKGQELRYFWPLLLYEKHFLQTCCI